MVSTAQSRQAPRCAARAGGCHGAARREPRTRAGNVWSSIVVNLAWSGTATYATDYTVTASGGALAGNGTTIAFAPGQAQAVVTVTTVDDAIYEPSETVTLTLKTGTRYTVGSPASASGTIADNEAAPTISIQDASVVEGDSGTKTLAIPVTLSVATTAKVTVLATTVAGTALAGKDFTSTSVTLTFNPGVTVVYFNVPIIGEKKAEPTETFRATLSKSSGAAIGRATATITIVDNDSGLAAAAAPAEPTAVAALDTVEVGSTLGSARMWWAARGFDAAALAPVQVSVVDLPGIELGKADGDVVYLDADAGGWGWASGAAATTAGAIDLRRVLIHELGHLLGLSHLAAGGLPVMAGTLESAPRVASFTGSAAAAGGGVSAPARGAIARPPSARIGLHPSDRGAAVVRGPRAQPR